MRDVLLHRNLRVGERQPGDLAELAELAKRPTLARLPFVACLLPLLRDRGPQWRVAALGALAGLRGHAVESAIVARLDDDDPSVRAAALAALRRSPNPHRFAHALLHRRDDVRRAALTSFPSELAPIAFALRADDACVDAVPDGLRPPSPRLRFLHTFLAMGRLPRDEAQLWILELSRDALFADAASFGPLRDPRALLRWLFEVFEGAPRERFDRLLDHLDSRARSDAAFLPIVVEALHEALARVTSDPDGASQTSPTSPTSEASPTSETSPTNETSGARPTGLAPSPDHGSPGETVRSLDRDAKGRGADPVNLAQHIAKLDATFFVDARFPVAFRRAILRRTELARAPSPRDEARDALAATLLGSALVRDDEGRADLRAAVRVATLSHTSPYGLLVDAFGFDALADALAADSLAAGLLYERVGNPPRDRAWFLAELAHTGVAAAIDARAVTLLHASREAGPLRRALDAERDAPDVVEVVARAIAIEAPFRLSSKRAERLAEGMLACVPITSSEALLRAVVAAEWLEADDAPGPLADRIVGGLACRLGDALFPLLEAMSDPVDAAHRLVRATTFPFVLERALAERWAADPDPRRRAFATPRLPVVVAAATPTHARVLSDATRHAIATGASLARELAAVRGPCLGLTAALARRLPESSVTACAVLVVSHDPIDEVLRELARFEEPSATFEELVLTEVPTRWLGAADLPLLAHAALRRWEKHAFLAFDLLAPTPDALVASLARFRGGPSPLARRLVWNACARAFALHRWRSRPQLAPFATPTLLALLVETLDTELGPPAARMLVSLYEARVADEALRALHPAVMRLLPRLDDVTRSELRTFASVRGLPPRRGPRRSFVNVADERATIRRSSDLAELRGLVGHGHREVAEEAIARLFELGAPGAQVLLAVLADSGPGAELVACFAGLFDRDHDPTLHAILAVAPPRVRFHLALELGSLDVAIDAANAPLDDAGSWLDTVDVTRLIERLGERGFALALATSPHPDVYEAALRFCLAHGLHEDDAIRDAIRAFLAIGDDRLAPLRLEAARWLARRADDLGMPVLVAAAFESHASTLARVPLRHAVHGALALGSHDVEERVAQLVPSLHHDDDPELAELWLELLRARSPAVRALAASALAKPSRARQQKIRTLAEIFAWGIRRGRGLTGRLIRVHLTSERAHLGYTHLGSAAIHVGGWPIFDGAPHGRDVVEGLVIHELGHQKWHADPASRALWKKASEQGLQHLYNLVLDEHLERRLRALDPADGDRLKRLGAYAFQHAGHELRAVTLVGTLGPSAVAILRDAELEVAVDEACVHVSSGAILRAASEHGSSFSRFVRALRMGLGDRHDDALVRAGLALFDRSFKELDTTALYAITERLAALFGSEAELLRCVGTLEELPGGDPRRGERAEGIVDGEVQREVQRILAPPKAGTSSSGGGALVVNVGPDESFDRLVDVVRLPVMPDRQRALTLEVARPARRLRADLEALGLARERVGARLSGSRLDRGRLRGLVLRRDPHVLQTRVLVPRTDLFVGVAVDCSGSMVGTSMELARRFAVLLASSARGLAGVDLRVFGFTDLQLFDAGDAERSAAASFEPGGGNNDAGALAHLAELARRSRRRAKLLVMISDGLPTECSVAALRKLVRRYTSEGMACAQIAVRPLEERCFDHYVEVRETDPDEATRRFGAVISRLVRGVIAPS